MAGRNRRAGQRRTDRDNRAVIGGMVRNHVHCYDDGTPLESRQHAKRHRIRSAKQLATLGIHVSSDNIGVIVRGLNAYGCPIRTRGQVDNLAIEFSRLGGEYWVDQTWRFPYPPGGGDDFGDRLNTLFSYVYGLYGTDS